MNYPSNDWRNRRNLLNHHHIGTMASIGPMHYSIANYSTGTQSKKTEMKEQFRDDIFLSKFHMIPNPLQKNLADTIVTSEPNNKTKMSIKTQEMNHVNMGSNIDKVENRHTNDYQSTFSGITSFISGVFNIISGSFFQRKTKSNMECFDKDFDVCSQSFNAWQTSNFEDLNKNSLGDDQLSSSNIDIKNINHSEMLNDCRNAAEQCEGKLDKVRHLLSSKVVPIPQKTRPRRPRKIFVEPSSVEDNFEDAFSPEYFCSSANESYVEHISPFNIQNQELSETSAAKVKTEIPPVQENMEIVNSIDIKMTDNLSHEPVAEEINKNMDETKFTVLSCEDKLNKLKAFLQDKKNMSRTDKCKLEFPIEKTSEYKNNRATKMNKDKLVHSPKVKDKHFKNSHRLRSQKKSHLRRNMLDDMSFANEIDCDNSSIENSPSLTCNNILNNFSNNENQNREKDYFDEIIGRFRTSSATESDDSFQIVFADSPKHCQPRRMSDCDSEDSFIVFEDPPDYCYTSTDVFGEEPSDYDSECSDSESDYSDSGCGASEITYKLSHSLSRTIGDLTDDSLYEDGIHFEHTLSEDEIDSSPITSGLEMPAQVVNNISEVKDSVNVECKQSTGLLLDETKKLLRQNQAPKKVQFSAQPPTVHVLRVWAFAARQARAGHWERLALDRDRFKRRIADVEMAVSWVLKPQHRSRIMFQRIMPWRNAQKRKELEEKKLQEEEEKKQQEEMEQHQLEEVEKKQQKETEQKEHSELEKEEETKYLEVKLEEKQCQYLKEKIERINGNANEINAKSSESLDITVDNSPNIKNTVVGINDKQVVDSKLNYQNEKVSVSKRIASENDVPSVSDTTEDTNVSQTVRITDCIAIKNDEIKINETNNAKQNIKNTTGNSDFVNNSIITGKDKVDIKTDLVGKETKKLLDKICNGVVDKKNNNIDKVFDKSKSDCIENTKRVKKENDCNVRLPDSKLDCNIENVKTDDIQIVRA